MNLLFVDERHTSISRTAEVIFDRLGHQTKSAGVHFSSKKQVNAKLISWANMIFIMHQDQAEALHKRFSCELLNKEMVCLNISVLDFNFMEKSLVNQLLEECAVHICIKKYNSVLKF